MATKTKSLRILHISDTHNLHWQIEKTFGPMPDADILCHTGDLTNEGTDEELASVNAWFSGLKHRFKKIIVILGNHDVRHRVNHSIDGEAGEKAARELLDPNFFQQRLSNATVLINDMIDVEGLKIFGSSWSPWHETHLPENGAPTRHHWGRRKMFELLGDASKTHDYGKIPPGVHILMTHAPPLHVLDCVGPAKAIVHWQAGGVHPVDSHLAYWGSSGELRKQIERVRPQVHLYGHLHEQRGVYVKISPGVVPAKTTTRTTKANSATTSTNTVLAAQGEDNTQQPPHHHHHPHAEFIQWCDERGYNSATDAAVNSQSQRPGCPFYVGGVEYLTNNKFYTTTTMTDAQQQQSRKVRKQQEKNEPEYLPFPTFSVPDPAAYPCSIISNNSMLNHSGIEKIPSRIAGPPRLIIASLKSGTPSSSSSTSSSPPLAPQWMFEVAPPQAPLFDLLPSSSSNNKKKSENGAASSSSSGKMSKTDDLASQLAALKKCSPGGGSSSSSSDDDDGEEEALDAVVVGFKSGASSKAQQSRFGKRKR